MCVYACAWVCVGVCPLDVPCDALAELIVRIECHHGPGDILVLPKIVVHIARALLVVRVNIALIISRRGRKVIRGNRRSVCGAAVGRRADAGEEDVVVVAELRDVCNLARRATRFEADRMAVRRGNSGAANEGGNL